jgi:hypothetical protein
MTELNWRLIALLSLFGLAMAFATVWIIPSNVEPLFWLAIFVTCAVLIARGVPAKHFLHGFFVSLVNSVWITTAHVAFAAGYLARHPQEAQMAASGPFAGSPRLAMAVTGPLIGIVSGLVLGLFAFIAARLMKRPADQPRA